MKKKYGILAVVSVLFILIDQATKWFIHTHYQLGESTTVLQNFFNITYVRNMGAAFGFLAESHPAFREIFFLSMPPIALVIILLILRGVQESDRWQIYSLSSVFAGAIGNYIDRLRFRYVIDFLDFHFYEKYSWPAFNVADMAIVCGVCALLLQMLAENKKANNENQNAKTAS
jgi:signal peptidase II